MRQILLVVTSAVLLYACTFSAPTMTPILSTPVSSALTPSTPTVDMPVPKFLEQIDRAEERWQKHEIDHYRIEVMAVRSTWHAQSHRLVVRSGQVVASSASCIPAPAERGKCEVEPFDANEYTVPALFDRAREKTRRAPDQTRITFDPRYGFPSWIVDDGPGVVDGGGVWKVEAFEVLD